ncbi:hypothetical protein CCH79_00004864 [Gambusia affinis]|uniref:Ubiquitin-like protease family profile domain-containing protein n=1 Tax=Gambusia affinis TaxID=33528 RepID=A0A315V823_GAMAF|nr:hypothetical protein CCH79_00004864 [Gambusia affinis]
MYVANRMRDSDSVFPTVQMRLMIARAMRDNTRQRQRMDPVVLSYQDSLLRRSDVSLLEGPYWLNDQVIGFAFEYFANERFRVLGDAAIFISPEVTQFIKCASCPDELALFLEPLDLPSRRWVFLANGINLLHARRIASKLEPFLGAGRKALFVEEPCPSQQNSYDCGISFNRICVSTPDVDVRRKHFVPLSTVNPTMKIYSSPHQEPRNHLILRPALGKLLRYSSNGYFQAKQTRPTRNHSKSRKRTIAQGILVKAAAGLPS